MRALHGPIIKENRDRSTGVYAIIISANEKLSLKMGDWQKKC
jgi:hypothetical protein